MTSPNLDLLIDEFFAENYGNILAQGGGHILTPLALAQAKEQVQHYWTKMRDVAVRVTDTEVRLQLPNQKTPKGRSFVIEGVVDLVREADRIRMYDVKTHFCEEVRSRPAMYAAQLNVYAYIWRELRQQDIHELGVIAMQLPRALGDALREGRTEDASRELSSWNPLVDIPLNPAALDETFREIAQTVDRIEDGEFEPPPVATLLQKIGDIEGAPRFATLHCRNCDGRFSCSSYREYVLRPEATRLTGRFNLRQYLRDERGDDVQQDWLTTNLEPDMTGLLDVDVDIKADASPRTSSKRTAPPKQTATPKQAAASTQVIVSKQKTPPPRRTSSPTAPAVRGRAASKLIPSIPSSGPLLRKLLQKLESEHGVSRAEVATACDIRASTLAVYSSKEEIPESFRERLRAFLRERLSNPPGGGR